MVVVNFVGNLDKKILTFPIANAYSVMGTTLIVTDDDSYSWYLTEEKKIGDVRVLIKPENEITFSEERDYDDGTEYQYVIYDTKFKTTFDKNQTIVVRNKDRSMIPIEIRDITDEADINGPITPSFEVVLTAMHNKIEEKKKGYLKRGNELKDKAMLIQLKPEHFKWLQECSETKEILALKDKKALDTIVSLVDGIDKISAKNLIQGAKDNPVEKAES